MRGVCAVQNFGTFLRFVLHFQPACINKELMSFTPSLVSRSRVFMKISYKFHTDFRLEKACGGENLVALQGVCNTPLVLRLFHNAII